MHTDHLVVGAGISGLTCAGELNRAGHSVVVVEKARGVGGRCATRRVQGQPVDFGPAFVHGSEPDFVELVRSIPNVTLLENWPRRRRGAGKPCQHEAFLLTEKRFAIAEGLTQLPKFLAQGLDVRLRTHVTEISLDHDELHVAVEGGQAFRTRSLVLGLPVEQALSFVWPLSKHSDELEAVAMLLDMVPTLPCLTVLAGYGLDTPIPRWEVFYPEEDGALMLVSHDSAKRTEAKFRTLVVQATPRWSRMHMDDDPEVWSTELLEHVGELIGQWVVKPKWKQVHQWRHSRVDLGNELTGPVRILLPGGSAIGMVGDVFAPGGGVEAAWNAGRTLARRLLREEEDNG